MNITSKYFFFKTNFYLDFLGYGYNYDHQYGEKLLIYIKLGLRIELYKVRKVLI